MKELRTGYEKCCEWLTDNDELISAYGSVVIAVLLAGLWALGAIWEMRFRRDFSINWVNNNED